MDIKNYMIEVWILLCIVLCYYGIPLQYINILLMPVVALGTLFTLLAIIVCIIILTGWFPKSLAALSGATIHNKYNLKDDEYYKRYYKR